MSDTPRPTSSRAASQEQVESLLGITDEADNMDLLGAFEPTDEPDNVVPDRRGLLMTSASVFGIALLGSIGFVAGLLWGVANEPELGYTNVAAELAIKSAFAIFCGLLGGAFVLAIAAAVAGVMWIRQRKAPAGTDVPQGKDEQHRPTHR